MRKPHWVNQTYLFTLVAHKGDQLVLCIELPEVFGDFCHGEGLTLAEKGGVAHLIIEAQSQSTRE